MPTKEQIKKYVKYVEGIETISRVHGFKFEELPKEEKKELQVVGKWLIVLSNGE